MSTSIINFKNAFKLFIGCVLVFSISCSPIKLADLLSPYDGYELTSGISYGSKTRQKLDIYKPITKDAKETILIFIYGGSWRSGSRSDYRFIAQSFASEGYTIIVPDYRLYPEVKFPAFVKDICKAILWVHQKYKKKNGKPKIILVGHSAGAHIAALLALDDRYLREEGASSAKIIKGWVALAGPHAFNPLQTKSTSPIFEDFKNKIKQTQPKNFARLNAPPGLLLHGNKDTVVYEKNSIIMADAIKEKKGEVTFKSLDGVGHIGILLSMTESSFFHTSAKQEIVNFIETLP
jgi:acetyl esterase/lipase